VKEGEQCKHRHQNPRDAQRTSLQALLCYWDSRDPGRDPARDPGSEAGSLSCFLKGKWILPSIERVGFLGMLGSLGLLLKIVRTSAGPHMMDLPTGCSYTDLKCGLTAPHLDQRSLPAAPIQGKLAGHL
jgi:hypothetical protein